MHSDRSNETDALEHVALFGNLHNRDETESQREKNRLSYQYMLSTVFDQIKECHDAGGWLITFKGNKSPTVCIPVLLATDGPKFLKSLYIPFTMVAQRGFTNTVQSFYNNVKSLYKKNFHDIVKCCINIVQSLHNLFVQIM